MSHRWISVDERLPGVYEEVLILLNGGARTLAKLVCVPFDGARQRPCHDASPSDSSLKEPT